jgi:hypothetical protein
MDLLPGGVIARKVGSIIHELEIFSKRTGED